MSTRPRWTLLRMDSGVADRMDLGEGAPQYLRAPAGARLAELAGLAPLGRRCVLFSADVQQAETALTPAAFGALSAQERERALALEWELSTGLDPKTCLLRAEENSAGGLTVLGIERARHERLLSECPGLQCAHAESVGGPELDPQTWFERAQQRLESGGLAVLEAPRAALPLRETLAGVLALLVMLGAAGMLTQQVTDREATLREEFALLSMRQAQWAEQYRLAKAQLEELERLRARQAARGPRERAPLGLSPQTLLHCLDRLALALPAGVQIGALTLDERQVRLQGLALEVSGVESLRSELLAAAPELMPLGSEQSECVLAEQLRAWRFELQLGPNPEQRP